MRIRTDYSFIVLKVRDIGIVLMIPLFGIILFLAVIRKDVF